MDESDLRGRHLYLPHVIRATEINATIASGSRRLHIDPVLTQPARHCGLRGEPVDDHTARSRCLQLTGGNTFSHIDSRANLLEYEGNPLSALSGEGKPHPPAVGLRAPIVSKGQQRVGDRGSVRCKGILLGFAVDR